MKAKLQIARELSLTDWLRLGEAWLTLFWFYVAIHVTSFERLNLPKKIKANSTITDGLAFARDLQRLVHFASRLHHLPMTCLPRTFTLRWMLNRRGMPAQVQIGVTKSPQGIHAHAWLEVDGQQVGEPEDVTERFQRFDLGAG
jgi:hypothetical protein